MDTIEKALRNLTTRDRPALSKTNEDSSAYNVRNSSPPKPAMPSGRGDQQVVQEKHPEVVNDVREAMEELSCCDDARSRVVAHPKNAQPEPRDLVRCRLLEPPDSYWNQRRGSAPEYVGNRPAQETFRQQSLGEQGNVICADTGPGCEGPYYGGARPRPIPVLQISLDEGDGVDMLKKDTSPDLSPVLEQRARTQRSHSLPGKTIMGFGEAIGAIASNEQPKFANTLSPRRTPGRRKSITVTEEGTLDPIDEDGTLKQACSRRYSATTVSYSDRGRRE